MSSFYAFRVSPREMKGRCDRDEVNVIIPFLRFSGTFNQGKDILKSLPRTHDDDGYIYLFQISPTRIKVGRTSDPFKRISGHLSLFKTYSGNLFSSISIFGPFRNAAQREREIIQVLKDNEGELYSGEEWFQFNKPLHIFDLNLSFDENSFLFKFTQESFDEIMKRNLKSLVKNGELKTQDLFYFWRNRTNLWRKGDHVEDGDYDELEAFLSLLKNFCNDFSFCHLEDKNSKIVIDNRSTLNWYCSF